jgi:hypothetical protein
MFRGHSPLSKTEGSALALEQGNPNFRSNVFDSIWLQFFSKACSVELDINVRM